MAFEKSSLHSIFGRYQGNLGRIICDRIHEKKIEIPIGTYGGCGELQELHVQGTTSFYIKCMFSAESLGNTVLQVPKI